MSVHSKTPLEVKHTATTVLSPTSAHSSMLTQLTQASSWVALVKRTGGCHSHRLYSHSCDRTQSTVNGQTTRIVAVNGQSRVKKTVNVQIPVWNRPDYSAVIRSEPVGWGYTCTQSLFPDLQARGHGLQLKYRDSLAGKISERSKVNGRKLAWSTVKPPKRAGQSFDQRSQL